MPSVGDLEGESSAAAKSQRSGEREEDSLHISSQEKKREGYSKVDKAARSNSVTAAAGKGGGAFNKFRTKYQASGIGQTKSYSSSSSTCSTQQRSSGGGRRTYVSGSKFLSSGTHANTSLVMKKLVQFLFIRKRKRVVHFHHTMASRNWLTISDWNARCTCLVNAFHDAVKDLWTCV